jgi:hypothetical protein
VWGSTLTELFALAVMSGSSVRAEVDPHTIHLDVEQSRLLRSRGGRPVTKMDRALGAAAPPFARRSTFPIIRSAIRGFGSSVRVRIPD